VNIVGSFLNPTEKINDTVKTPIKRPLLAVGLVAIKNDKNESG